MTQPATHSLTSAEGHQPRATQSTTSPATEAIRRNSPEALRRAIDQVATLRAQTIRIGLYGNLLYRDDPAGPTSQQDRDTYLSVLEREVTTITVAEAILTSGTAPEGIDPTTCAWIAQKAASMPQTLSTIQKMIKRSQDVAQAAKDQTPAQRDCLAAHMKTARDGFFEAVTRLADALWEDLNAAQDEDLRRTQQVAENLGEKLKRLERIGKHVRLVSLNASVEAARAGEVGKGLMVIASEFKNLAEEIQGLAYDATADLSAIS